MIGSNYFLFSMPVIYILGIVFIYLLIYSIDHWCIHVISGMSDGSVRYTDECRYELCYSLCCTALLKITVEVEVSTLPCLNSIVAVSKTLPPPCKTPLLILILLVVAGEWYGVNRYTTGESCQSAILILLD